jgi:hypothetical protein
LTGEETVTRGSDVRVARVGEEITTIVHDADANLVGAAFDTQNEHGCGVRERESVPRVGKEP